ncbi:MAG TPA: LytTR family DNA-binding domain-containing protein, partial [Cellvibrionaceae bacterium]
MTYLILLAVISCYRFIVRRLQGEASYMDESDVSSRPLPDRLLVKKLGKEFLIAVADISRIEASGNYANLYVGDSVYPMRITMTALEARLPNHFCRVHRSGIINIHRIDHIEPLDSGDYTISLRDGTQMSLSRRYRDNCKAMIAG